MDYFLSASFAFRLFDVAVAVTILMFIAWLVLLFVHQPVIRLCVIQCTLAAAFLLSTMSPMVFPPVSLQIFSAADPASQSNNVVFVAEHRPVVQVTPLQVDRSSTAQEMEPPPKATIASEKTPSLYLQWWQFAIVIYGSGTLVMICWLLLGQWSAWRLLDQASEATGDLAELWKVVDEELGAALGRPRKAVLMITDNLTYPAAIGFWKPVALIPEGYLNKSLAELKPLLAHEWSHCARHDVATRFLASLCQVIYYYQPLFWWLRREMRVNQEFLADDAALMCGPPPKEYAAQLFSLAAQTSRDWRPAPAVSIFEGRSDLYRRIHMLTNPIGPLRRRARVFTRASILISFFIAPLGLSFVTLRADVARPKDRGTKQEEGRTSAPIADETIPTQDQLRKDLNAAPQDLVGIVVIQVNRPIPDVQISLWHGMHTIRSDANGRFLLRMAEVHNAFDKDRLTLDFSRDGYANHTELDWDVKFREPPLARLTNDTSIEGIVRGPNGTPAPEVLVRAGKVEKPSVGITTAGGIFYRGVPAVAHTDENGHFKLFVEPAWYELEVVAPEVGTLKLPLTDDDPREPSDRNEKSGYATQWPKYHIRAADHRTVDLQLWPGIEFRAKFVDQSTGKPVQGIKISDMTGFVATTDRTGVAKISNLPRGCRYFRIDAPGYSHYQSADLAKFVHDTEPYDSRTVELSNHLPIDIADGMPMVTVELQFGEAFR